MVSYEQVPYLVGRLYRSYSSGRIYEYEGREGNVLFFRIKRVGSGDKPEMLGKPLDCVIGGEPSLMEVEG